MVARAQLHRRQRISNAMIDSLEPRRLLSAWTTVDNFKELTDSGANGIAADANGDIFAAGFAADSTQTLGLVRRSSDAGATWFAPLQNSNLNVQDIAVSGDGNTIFLVGDTIGASGALNWIVRKSNDAGLTWSTADQFSLGGSANTKANSITIDAAGNIYVAGQVGAVAGSNQLSWIVRRSQDGGTTWSTVDSISSGTYFASAKGLFASPTGGIFVAGFTPTGKKGNILQWTVRRSLDAGNTWATVDRYQLNSAYDSSANSVGMDAAGNLYTVGYADSRSTASLGTDHWTVRKSSNGGSTWTTVDDFPAQDGNSRATGFAKDSLGNLYVVGQNSHNWVVRSNPLGQGAWSTVDTFQLSTSGTFANAIVADGAGHVFVAGSANAADGEHWIVRETFVAPAAAPALAFSTKQIASRSNRTGQSVQVYAPHTHGIDEATADWWQWALAFSNDNPNPFTDPTGSLAGLNQSGHVFFMPGISGFGSATRTIQVPAGKPILIPLVVTELSTLEGAGNTPTQVRSADKSFGDLIDSLHASIDGVQVPNLFSHREVSPTFHFVAAPNNPIGDPAGDSGIAEADGYWLMLAPLSAGTHVINAGGGVSAFGATFDVTTTIIVTDRNHG